MKIRKQKERRRRRQMKKEWMHDETGNTETTDVDTRIEKDVCKA